MPGRIVLSRQQLGPSQVAGEPPAEGHGGVVGELLAEEADGLYPMSVVERQPPEGPGGEIQACGAHGLADRVQFAAGGPRAIEVTEQRLAVHEGDEAERKKEAVAGQI